MEHVFGVLMKFYASLAVVPFIPFILVWSIVYFLKKEKKKATHWAMDVTTVFLFGVVAVLYDVIFESSFGFYLLLLLFLLAFGLHGNAQMRKFGKVNLRRAGKVVWRLGFFGLSAAYVLFMAIGLLMSVLTV